MELITAASIGNHGFLFMTITEQNPQLATILNGIHVHDTRDNTYRVKVVNDCCIQFHIIWREEDLAKFNASKQEAAREMLNVILNAFNTFGAGVVRNLPFAF